MALPSYCTKKWSTKNIYLMVNVKPAIFILILHNVIQLDQQSVCGVVNLLKPSRIHLCLYGLFGKTNIRIQNIKIPNWVTQSMNKFEFKYYFTKYFYDMIPCLIIRIHIWRFSISQKGWELIFYHKITISNICIWTWIQITSCYHEYIYIFMIW